MILDVDAQLLFFLVITGVFLFLMVIQVLRHWSSKKTLIRVNLKNQANQKVNTRSFFIINLSALFLVVTFLLAPAVTSFKFIGLVNAAVLHKGVIFLIVPPVILLIALFYLNKKGDLSWLKTFRKQ